MENDGYVDDGVPLPGGGGHNDVDACEQRLKLPLGFRFHPTDEELVTYYLSRKVADHGFSAAGGVIGEVDLNKCEPWDLPTWMRGAATRGEKEWYFFCVRDRKYPAGLRANRATDSGYWKATGKDKEVRRRGADGQGKTTSTLVGRKKTLVFYEGRAPNGEKTPWVMHEYRLEYGSLSSLSNAAAAKNEWVICRVFQRGSRYAAAAAAAADGAGKKVARLVQERATAPIPPRAACYGVSGNTSPDHLLPPLMELPYGGGVGRTVGETTAAPGAVDGHVTCFSNVATGHKSHEGVLLPADYATSSPFLLTSGASAETGHMCYNCSSAGGVSSSVLPRGKHPAGEAGVPIDLVWTTSHGYAVQEGIGGGEAETAGVGTSGTSQETTDMNGRPGSSPLLLVSGHEVLFSRQKIPSDQSAGFTIPLADCIIWNY